MENSPLELYETAYKLHYSEHRIDDATIYYQRLIKEFPDSNECGYAVIQLQKIKANNVATDLKGITARKKGANGFILFLVIITCIAWTVIGYFYFDMNKRLSNEQTRTSLAFDALSKISRGNHEDALHLLNKLKKLKKEDITPYELCADIYRKNNKYSLARNEYTTFFKLNPAIQPSDNEKKFMNIATITTPEQNSYNVSQPPPASLLSSPEKNLPQPATPITPKKKASVGTRKKSSIQQPPPPKKSGSGLYLVDPDSLSYF